MFQSILPSLIGPPNLINEYDGSQLSEIESPAGPIVIYHSRSVRR
jgi:hypothetical protein